MFRRFRVVPPAILCLASGTVALAQDEPQAGDPALPPAAAAPPPTLPAPCPDGTEIEDRLRTVLDESECAAPERQLLLRLRQGESVTGTLVVLRDYQAEYVREVSGSSCREVESALTLALEIFLDPDEQGQGACAPKGAVAPAASTPADWPGQDLDPFNLPQPEPAPVVPVIEPQPSASLRLVPGVDSSYAPGVAFGLAATLRIRLTPQNFLGLTAAENVAPPFVATDGTVVHVSATTFGARFGQHLPVGLRGEFSLEVGPRLAILQVGTGTFEDWELAATVGIDLTVSLGVRLVPGIWAGVQGGGAFNLARARFLDGDSTLAWEQPWTGAHMGFYIAVAAPGQPARPRPPVIPTSPQ